MFIGYALNNRSVKAIPAFGYRKIAIGNSRRKVSTSIQPEGEPKSKGLSTNNVTTLAIVGVLSGVAVYCTHVWSETTKELIQVQTALQREIIFHEAQFSRLNEQMNKEKPSETLMDFLKNQEAVRKACKAATEGVVEGFSSVASKIPPPFTYSIWGNSSPGKKLDKSNDEKCTEK